MTELIIGVTGFKRHGKDSVANRLVSHWGFTKISYADTLKDVCAVAFGIPREDFDDDMKKEGPCDLYPDWTLRKLLQIVGTEKFRETWPDLWVDRAMQKAAEHELVVIPDMRFPNEVSRIREFPLNATLRVHNPRKEPSGDLHESEVNIPFLNVNTVISNDGDLAGLHVKVDQFMTDFIPALTGRAFPMIDKEKVLREHFMKPNALLDQLQWQRDNDINAQDGSLMR